MAVDTNAIRVNWQGSTTACQQAAAEVITVLCDEVDRLRSVLRDFMDNWDCDSDAHRHNTTCRCCSAEEALGE